MNNNEKSIEPTVSANWREKPAHEIFSGINVYSVWQGETNGKAMVVKIEPGSKWEGIDTHATSPEEIFVIEGTFNDGNHDYEAGTFIHYPLGTSHIPQSDRGCTLFVFYPD